MNISEEIKQVMRDMATAKQSGADVSAYKARLIELYRMPRKQNKRPNIGIA